MFRIFLLISYYMLMTNIGFCQSNKKLTSKKAIIGARHSRHQNDLKKRRGRKEIRPTSHYSKKDRARNKKRLAHKKNISRVLKANVTKLHKNKKHNSFVKARAHKYQSKIRFSKADNAINNFSLVKTGFLATDSISALSALFEKSKGRLFWPVDGKIVANYGKFAKDGIIQVNPGISIETAPDATVKNVFQGEVTDVADIGPVKAVTIRHGGYISLYSNLESVKVKIGQKLQQGDVIGCVALWDGNYILDFIIANLQARKFDPAKWLE